MAEPPEDAALALLGGSLVKAAQQQGTTPMWRKVAGAWVRLPSASTPWATLHFVGGAGLGVAPQLCYDSFLSGVSESAGIMVVATPYDLATDHERIAKRVGKDFDEAFLACASDGLGPPASSPVFRLGHSLGAKLLTILACQSDRPTCPLGLLAFNNFGVAESASYTAKVVAAMQGGQRGAEVGEQIANAISILKQISVATGNEVEFTPSPQELRQLVQESFPAETTTTLWRFISDDLDCADTISPSFPPTALVNELELPGSHLSPVAFSISLTDIDPVLGALLNAQGLGAITLGDETTISTIVESGVARCCSLDLNERF